MSQIKSARGFTLVEALVALLVLSIGLLGIAALQMTGLRANLGAGWRSQATYLSYDIIDRMRANRTVAINNGAYNLAMGSTPSGGTTAGADLVAWKANLLSLPGGDGSVAYNAATGIVTVTVRWNDYRAIRDSNVAIASVTALDFVTRSRL